VTLTAELADGWIPTIFSPRHRSLFRAWLDEGFRARGGAPAKFDIMPSCPVIVGDDVKICLAAYKPNIALYVGGMGARSRNFYNEVVRRYGYEEAATTIQDLYLAGRKAEAEAAVPDALVDEVTLCGPRERIRERLAEWKAAGVTTLGVRGKPDAIRLMAELAL
jgi:alkanesulfonate monooxygenase SsuD/methylene tetrahydromethanopterin reductase-like flavin-dependent oxidoreductase (luciferase family)